MRRIIVALVSLLAIALAFAPAAQSGEEPLGQILTVTKTVDGPGPDGPYEINVSCVPAHQAPDAAAAEVEPDITLLMLVDGQSESVDVRPSSECSVNEFVDQGADEVIYSCTPGEAATCTDDDTVEWGSDVADAAIEVTNVFSDEPEPEPDPGAQADAVEAPGPVTASPTFTG